MYRFSDVKKGSKGTDVFVLQAMLRNMLFTGKKGNPLDVDGIAGEDTVYAINMFQKMNESYGYSCGNGDSVFGDKCWKRLGLNNA